MQAIIECPICKGKSFNSFRTCKDYTVSHETFPIIKCAVCTLAITSPRPDNAELGKYYLSESYISHAKTSKGIIDKVYQISRLFTMRWKLNLIKQNVKQAHPSLLDFGCGTGEFLATCKKSGINVTGIEPSDVARANATDIVQTNIYPTLEEASTKFDVVTLWHVLEHVPDLNETISELKTKLNENGTMFIAVPNHESKDGSWYNNEWAGYDVPRHLWHFTQKSMKRLLSNHELILEKVIPMKLDAFYVSMLSEKYTQNSNGILSFLKGTINGLKSNFHARNTTQYSSLIYVIRK